jgi:hypothetical protein
MILLYNSVQKEQKADQIIVIGLCDQIPGDVSGSLRGSLYRICLSFELTATK